MAESFNPYYKWLGIPPEETPPNHYRLLGLRLFEPDREVIAAAADRQMAHVQTYKTGKYAQLSQQILNEISAARVVLLNAAKKQQYDESLQAELGEEDFEDVAEEEEPVDFALASTPPSYVRARRPAWWQNPVGLIVLLCCLGLPIGLLVFLSSIEPQPVAKNNPPAKASPQPSKPAKTMKQQPTSPTNPLARVSSPNDPLPPIQPRKLPEFQRGETIDLLKQIDPEEHAVVGGWQKDAQGRLVSPSFDRPRLLLPIEPPAEYELRVAAERIEGSNALKIGLVSSENQFGAIFDAYEDGDISGLHLINEIGANRNETHHRGTIFTGDHSVEIRCTVYRSGVHVSYDDQEMLHWQGDSSELSLWQGWDVQDSKKLFLGSLESSYRFESIELTPLKSK